LSTAIFPVSCKNTIIEKKNTWKALKTGKTFFAVYFFFRQTLKKQIRVFLQPKKQHREKIKKLKKNSQKMEQTYFRTKQGLLLIRGDPNMVWHFVAYCTGEVKGISALRVPTRSAMDVMTQHYDSNTDELSSRKEMVKNYRQYLQRTFKDVSSVPDVDKILKPYDGTTLDFDSYSATYTCVSRC
jgi:hypothetical protein